MLIAGNPYFLKKQKITVLYLVKYTHFKWKSKGLYVWFWILSQDGYV